MEPERAAGHDEEVEVQIDHVIIDLAAGGVDEEMLAREITASIVASLRRLELEG